MATKYCDHGAYGAYAAIPTWGAAQDGDGTAISVGTPSTAEIVFTGIASTGIISVLGRAITFTRVTDANTCANNLATAINASTAVATGPASFTVKSQVRNHVYARGPANGAPAGTCQIMTRQASASHAGLIAVTHTLNNVSSAATVTFAGGTGGCWGYVCSPLTTWPSALGLAGYGLFCSTTKFTGEVAEGDEVKVRSGKIIQFAANTSPALQLNNMGSFTAPVRIDIDNGVVWPVDAPNPVFEIRFVNTASYAASFETANTAHVHLKGVDYGTSKNFIVSASGNGGNQSPQILQRGSSYFEDLEFSCLSTGGNPVYRTPSHDSRGREHNRVLNCNFKWVNSVNRFIEFGNSGFVNRSELVGCNFSVSAQATPLTTSFFMANSAGARLRLESCSFTGFVSGSRLLAVGSAASSYENVLIANNCDFGGIDVIGPNFLTTPLTGQVVESEAGFRGFFASSQFGNREFAYDRSGKCYVEWVAAKSRPTLGAVLPDGVTSWSIFAVPTSVVGNISSLSPVSLPPISKRMLDAVSQPEAVRTITVNFLVESNLATWTTTDISVLVTYQSTTGGVFSESSHQVIGTALQSSDAGWSSVSWNGQTWLKKKIVFTTKKSVRAASEVTAAVNFHTPVTSETWGIILDPELLVS